MIHQTNRLSIVVLLAFILVGCQTTKSPVTLRVATFNIEDIRTEDLENPEHERLKNVAKIIQELKPDIILLNEIASDQIKSPMEQNGQRFVDTFLKNSPIQYKAFMASSNTGIHSGFDLNNDGILKATVPPQAKVSDGVRPQTPADRDYGNDSWGFGAFPGQYAMTLLVNEAFTIDTENIRTFQNFLWKDMPHALQPINPETQESWYNEAEWAAFPLSSKSHWDIPVLLPNGSTLHVLCSHPTPPAFDGTENRNKNRNHDEIRFWADYLSQAKYIYDDSGSHEPLPKDAYFVILGDQNADPDEGNTINNAIDTWLLKHPRINGTYVPKASKMIEGLDIDDTAQWGLRADYVLPSKNIKIQDGGIRHYQSEAEAVSDHFPVWIDIEID